MSMQLPELTPADHKLQADDLLPESLNEFLACITPDSWLKWALDNPEILLVDHAQCERKGRLDGHEFAVSLCRPTSFIEQNVSARPRRIAAL